MMRSAIFQLIPAYGKEIIVYSSENPDGRVEKGFLQPVGNAVPEHSIPGISDGRSFLVILAPDGIVSGETEITLAYNGMEYELMCINPLSVGGTVTHLEGYARVRGPVKSVV